MENMSLFDGFHLCEITDCKLNKEEICTINANFDDAMCNTNRVIPETRIQKEYDAYFNQKECFEISVNSASKGAQRKWISGDKQFLIKEQFYYQLRHWNDDLVEVLASDAGHQLGINCVKQYLGNISGKDCSYSRNWGEKKFIPFGRLDNYKEVEEFHSVTDRIKYTSELLYNNSGLDCTQYLSDMIFMDFLIGNEDRHFFNFGLLYNGIDYEVAPLFDFGLGLFEHDVFYKNLTFEQCISKMSKKPFHDWDKALDYFADVAVLPDKCKIKVRKKLLPNNFAEPYLLYSCNRLGIEVIICD